MESGKFYAFYKPSFVNGFEGFIDKDIYYELLQAIEKVARDELTFTGLTEECQKELKASSGLITESIARRYFNEVFDTTYNVEFLFNPSLSSFKRKISVEGEA